MSMTESTTNSPTNLEEAPVLVEHTQKEIDTKSEKIDFNGFTKLLHAKQLELATKISTEFGLDYDTIVGKCVPNPPLVAPKKTHGKKKPSDVVFSGGSEPIGTLWLRTAFSLRFSVVRNSLLSLSA